MAALQIAKLLGARAIVTSGSDAKLETAARAGRRARRSITELPTWWRKCVGRPAAAARDVVVDSVGEATWAEFAARAPPRRPAGDLRRDHRSDGVAGPAPAVLAPVEHPRLDHGQPPRVSRRSCGWRSEGRLWPVVDSVVPLAEAPRRYARMQRGEQTGKLVIEVAP